MCSFLLIANDAGLQELSSCEQDVMIDLETIGFFLVAPNHYSSICSHPNSNSSEPYQINSLFSLKQSEGFLLLGALPGRLLVPGCFWHSKDSHKLYFVHILL